MLLGNLVIDPSINEAYTTAKQAFATNITRDVQFRKGQLRQIMRMVNENEKDIVRAICSDLPKPAFEADICETSLIRNATETMLSFFDDYAKVRNDKVFHKNRQ